MVFATIIYMLNKLKPSKNLIYLDNAATTAIDPKVAKAMQPYYMTEFGNPSSLYRSGQQAAYALNMARQTIAESINANSKEVVFTAGGTESINLAIFGVARQYELDHKHKGHIISSTIEHHAVLHSLEALKEEGWQITLVDVNKDGFIKLDELKRAVKKNTVLVSIMYANNEVGSIQPILEIGKWLAGLNKVRIATKLPSIVFHSDACQAGNSLDLNVHKLGVDLLSVNGSKIHAPKQTGFLYVKSGIILRPILFGGGQERNLRSGTENVAGFIGLAKALALAQENRIKQNKNIKTLHDYLLNQILKTVRGVSINGPDDRKTKLNNMFNQGLRRLPNNINISIKGIEGEMLMFYMDSYNVAIATGSACTSASTDPSHVILALGKAAQDALSSIRITLSKYNTKKEIDYTVKALSTVIKQLNKAKS